MKKLMIVGEAWGEKEEEEGQPFVGPSGKLLKSYLRSAHIALNNCYFTNVFNFRPKPSGKIENLCGPRGDGIPRRKALTPRFLARSRSPSHWFQKSQQMPVAVRGPDLSQSYQLFCGS